MAQIFSRPITDEQKKAADAKRVAAQTEAQKDDQSLITAFLLQKIAALEAKLNDKN